MSSNTDKKEDGRVGLREGSRPHQIAELEVGGYLTDSVFLPLGTFDRDALQEQRKAFNQQWGVAVQRAATKNPKMKFATQTFTAVNPAGDMCLTLVVQRIA